MLSNLLFFWGISGFNADIGLAWWIHNKNYVFAYSQLIASGLLVFIGIKIIYEAFYRKPEGRISSLNYSVLLMLAVATSIDALILGISLTFLKVPILEPAIIVGCVTFIIVFCGAIIG